MAGHRMRRLSCVAALLVLVACGEDEGPEPYFEFAGGGFVFNYRQASITYGFVVRVVRQPPEGGMLEAVLEDPAGGPAIVLRQPVKSGRQSYKFESPPVTGVRKDTDYQVELRLFAKVEGAEAEGSAPPLARITRAYRSQLDEEILPDSPLAVGPGYHRPDGSVPAPARDGGTRQ